MTKSEFDQRYLESVHKAALGIEIIRRKGPEMGFDADVLKENEHQMVKMLADGVGISFHSVSADVYDQVNHFPRSFFRRSDVQRVMNQMLPQMKVAGFLT
jgi:hypothetical protein